MPELPEVEVLRRSLEPRLTGRRLTYVDIHSPALREPLDREALGRLANRRVTGLRRRAKYLLIHTDTPDSLVVHLGMSGRLTVVPSEVPVAKHEHLGFGLSDGGRLRLEDPRRFGQAFVMDPGNLPTDRRFVHLGIEPLEGELDGSYLKARADGRRGPIKPFLMDSRVVVGVGNIYATEVLWRTRVHPKRSVARIGRGTWERLAETVGEVLTGAIAEGGTTLADFRDGEGNSGYFQVSLAAYGREGEPCFRCETPIRRLVQAGRSTFYCPRCQR